MSAVYGFTGDPDDALLATMGERLSHRGGERKEWSPTPDFHVGVRWPAGSPNPASSGRFPVALDGCVQARDPEDGDGLPDARLLLQSLETEGAWGLRRLRGPFAAAVAIGDAVWLARDPLGYRQLYYTVTDARVLFASEYKALLADPAVPARPNRQAIQHIHRLKTQPVDQTCLEGVFPVPPGCCVRMEGGRVDVERYWDYRSPETSADRPTMVEELRRRLSDALRAQVERAPRVGVALSGGLDSTVTLALLRALAPDREIATFSAGYGEDDPELVGAAAAAEYFGTTHRQIVMEPHEFTDVLPTTVWHMEEPVGREDTTYLYRTCQVASESVDLLISGYDADLLFGGMPRHLLVKVGELVAPLKPALHGFLEYARFGRLPSSLAGRLLVRAYYRGDTYPAPSVLGVNESAEELSLKVPTDVDRPLTAHLRRQAVGTSHGTYDGLHQAFGLSMASPFGDQEVIDWAFRLPDDVKIRRLEQKWILREVAALLLPVEAGSYSKTLQRLKHDLKFSRVLEGLSADLLSHVQVSERGIFDGDYVGNLIQRRRGEPYSSEAASRIWSLLLTEAWARAFLDKRGAR